MSDDQDTLTTRPDHETEKPRALTLGALSDEQLAMIAASWAAIGESKTPLADLRGAMTDSGLFEFLPKYETNNIQLRELATHAQGELETRHEHHHKKELQAILDATKDKSTYADKRAALSDLLGFRRIYDMNNLELDQFIADADRELSSIEAPETSDVGADAPQQTTNRELADQVADLLDGQLAVDSNDHVRYGSGATAHGQKVGGRFESESHLRDIAAHQEQIRDGLASRDVPGPIADESPREAEPADDSSIGGDEVGEDAYLSRHEAHTHEDEVPAEGGDVEVEPALGETPSFSAAFLDTSRSAHARALEAAEAKRRSELQEGGRVRRFLRNLWKGENAIAGAYIFERYKKQMLDAIIETQDTLVHETDDAEARAAAEFALIERFKSEYDDEEMLHAAAGEKRQELSDDSEFGRGLKDLVRRFANGEISDAAALEEEKKRLVAELRDRGDPDLLGEGLVSADDFLELAQNVKAAVEHGYSLERVIEQMKLYTGVAADGIRSEAHLSRVDKVVERLRESKITALVSPTTISMAAAIGLGVARAGRGSLIKALGVTVAPGVLGGGFAALRENQRVKVERALHAREMAQGKQYTEGDKRREQMEEARYETVGARELTDQLERLFTTDEPMTPEQLQAAYEAIAATETRVKLSDRRKIDYISFSDVTAIESERLALNIARAKAKIRLGRELGNLPQLYRDTLGITEDMSVDQALSKYTDTLEALNEDASQKDAAFAKLKHARVAKAAAVGFATSFVIGTATQEALAAVMPNYDGLAEHIFHQSSISKDGQQTLLEGVFHGQTGSSSSEHILPSSTYNNYTVAGHKDLIQLPSNYNLTTNPDSTITVTAPDGSHVLENFQAVHNGTLDPAEVKTALEAHGVSVSESTTPIEVSHTETKPLTIQEYNAHNKANLTKITRDYWDDNDTWKHDKNELKLWWGGTDNKGVSATGGAVMDVSRMTADGSYHGLDHTNWHQEAADGHLKLAVSGSRGTQSEVYMVDVKPDGTVDIPAGSPAAAFFSKDASGQMQFHGAYAEVVKVEGTTDGVTHVVPLATEVGDGSVKTIPTEITTKTTEYISQFKITPPAIEHVAETPGKTIEAFGGPAIVTRKPLERMRGPQAVRPKDIEPFFGYTGYGIRRGIGEMQEWVNAEADRLRTRSEVTREDGTKEWVEADGSKVERNINRERDTLSAYLDREYAASPGYSDYINQIADRLGPMDDNCRVSVNIPAWMEEKSIPHLLTEYIDQRDKDGNSIDPALFEVNLIINRKVGTPADGSVQAVETFLRDYASAHPGAELPRVRYIDVEFPPEYANVGHARKVLTDAVLARSLRRSNQTKPLYIESEDADLLKVDRRVITNLISKLDKNPHLDAVRGIEGRMPDYMKENDLLLMRRNAWEVFLFMARQKRYRDPKNPKWNGFANRTITGGWNSGYTAEAYAMIGGYENARAGEDISIGERISMVRGDGVYPNLETIGSVPTRTESSPRRFINEIIRRSAAYDQFGEGPDEQRIRDMDIPELMKEITDYARINKKNQHEFEGEASMFYDWCKSASPTEADAREMTKRVMYSVGYREGDYRFVGDGIEITNWGNVVRNLSDYRSQFGRAQRPERKMTLSGWRRANLRTSPQT